jgi:hypothetical protein
MTSAPAVVKKSVVNGSLWPRWPKPRVVRWLELGAIPALVGLWLPDWAGAYAGKAAWLSAVPAFPPLLTYLGAVILLKACAEGIKDMGGHYLALRVSGGLALAFAAASLVLHFLIPSSPRVGLALTLLAVGLAAFFATGFFWFTIAKVAEITVEARTARTRQAVAVAGVVALLLGGATVLGVLVGDDRWPLLLRATVVAFTVAFGLCRYGVHCYKTQRSIGATFSADPAEQFWAWRGDPPVWRVRSGCPGSSPSRASAAPTA